MLNNKKITAIILLGGVGNRFKNDTPKQFHKILNKKIYLYSLEAFYNANVCDEVILVTHPDYIKEVEKDISSYPPTVKIVTGGKFRQTSVLNGLKACSFKDIVIIHDSARPFITNDIIIKNIQGAIDYKAADTCIKSSDTLVCINDNNEIVKIPDRSKILRGQTPQTFDYALIYKAH